MPLPSDAQSTRPCLELHVLHRATRRPLDGATVWVKVNDVESELITDASGIALVPHPEERRSLLMMISVQKAGYVTRGFSFPLIPLEDDPRPDEPEIRIPESFDLEMDATQSIGGVVHDEEGLPIEGTTVMLRVEWSGEFQGCGLVSNGPLKKRVVTDKDGKWEWADAALDLRKLQIVLNHPDYVSNELISPLPQLRAFQQKTAHIIQKKGVPCEGNIRNEAGEPIVDAIVAYGEKFLGWGTSRFVKTDSSGYFRFGGLPPFQKEGHIFTVTSEDYAPELIEFPPDVTCSPLRVTLGKGHPLRVRVVDSQGQPVPKVEIVAERWRNHRSLRCQSWDTDADGTVVWEHAPSDPIGYWFYRRDFESLELDLQPGEATQTVILQRRPGFRDAPGTD